MEEWRWIPGHEGMYEISNQGRVRSYVRSKVPRPIKPYFEPRGYVQVVFTIARKQRTYWLHRLVAGTFLTNPDQSFEVNHKDGVKSNNAASNLEWISHSENIAHSWALELRKANAPKGEQHYLSKFSDSDVIAIRKRYAEGGISHAELGKQYGVTRPTIGYIIRRKRWSHI